MDDEPCFKFKEALKGHTHLERENSVGVVAYTLYILLLLILISYLCCTSLI